MNESANQETASLCGSHPGKVHAHTADVTSLSSWQSILSTALSQFKNRLDVVVNCAGVINLAGPSHEMAEDEFDRVFKVNVKPSYLSTKVIVPFWKQNGVKGLFLNMSSITELRPRPNLVWYSSSKGAVTVVGDMAFPCCVVIAADCDTVQGHERSRGRVCRRWNQIQLYSARRGRNGDVSTTLLFSTRGQHWN